MPEDSLVRALEAAASSDRGVRFLDRKEHERRFSYEEVLTRASRVAGGLHRMGLKRGDRVAVILPTGPEFFDAFFGVMLSGAVPVPMYPPVRIGRLDEYHVRTSAMIRGAGARLVITDSRIRRLLGVVIQRALPELGCEAIESIDRGAGRLVRVRADDPTFIQYSSGTTARPKPVCITHRQALANVRALLAAMLDAYPEGGELPHSGVSWLPLYHDMGLVGGVFSALAHPGDLTLIPPELFVARPSVWLRTISKYRATISMAPNFAYALCADRVTDEELRGVDLSSWRVALNGAEPVTPSVLERFITRFAPHGFRREALSPVYGLAEATLAVTFSDLRRPFSWTEFDGDQLVEYGRARPDSRARHIHALASVGKPLRGFEVRIVDDRGEPVGDDRIGHVHVKGPSVMQGYLGMSEATSRSFDGEWLVSGDTGFLHAGELYLYGRHKDMIVLRGCNYAPQDVEQILDTVPGVRTGCCAAFGVVPSQGDGEQLVVLVEGRRRRAAGSDELAALATQRITDRIGLVPADVVILEPGTLPRTSSGKIRRAAARYRYLTRTLRAPKRVTAWRLADAMVRSAFSFVRVHRGEGEVVEADVH